MRKKSVYLRFFMPCCGDARFGKQCLPDQKGSKQKDSARRRNFLFLLVGDNPQTPMIEDFIFGGAPDGAYFSSCWCSR